MSAIFLSYRRGDSSEIVGRIYDRLAATFSNSTIFRDIDSIPLGKSFPDALNDAIQLAGVGLVVIGPHWASITDEQGYRRVDEQADFVRREVEGLLLKGIPVIPCLVGNANMPRADELPSSIRSLLHRQAIRVRPDPDFHRDMDRLIERISAQVKDLRRIEKQRLNFAAQSRRRLPKLVMLGLASTALSVWIGLDIGFDRDRLFASFFIFIIPAAILGLILVTVRGRSVKVKQ